MTLVSNGGTTTLGLYDTQSQLAQKADITYVDNKVDPLVGGHKGFATLALAQAAQGTLPSGSVVEVTNDSTASNNGLYLWNGTTLTKSAYDPLTQAKKYTDDLKLLLSSDIAKNKDDILNVILALHQCLVSIDSIDKNLRSELNIQVSSLLDLTNKLTKAETNLKSNSDFLTSILLSLQTLISSLLSEKGETVTEKELLVKTINIQTEVSRTEIPAFMSKDGIKCWSVSSNVLYESLDGGKTWSQLYSFSNVQFIEWVRELDNGELLLQVILFVYEGQTKVRDRYFIYRTEGKNTSNITMVECFNIEPEGVFASHAWSVSDYKNIILVGEYGAKYGAPWGNIIVEEGKNARYVRMSLDYGKTWKVIFDLNSIVVKDQCHVHGVCYDQYWNRIWLTYGDGENGTMYSDDLGSTWHFAHHDLNFEGEHQNVGIVALPDCILFATDYHPDGIQRISRAYGKNTTDGTYPIDIAYFIDVGQTQRNYVGMSICYANKTEYSPVLFGFTAETANSKSCVIGTYDGWNFFKLWMDDLIQPTGKGLEFVCGVTLNNEVIIRSNDSRTTGSGKRTKITLTV